MTLSRLLSSALKIPLDGLRKNLSAVKKAGIRRGNASRTEGDAAAPSERPATASRKVTPGRALWGNVKYVRVIVMLSQTKQRRNT